MSESRGDPSPSGSALSEPRHGDPDDSESSGPSPTDPLMRWEPTGNPGVDGAVGGLARLAGLTTPEHADVYEDVHRGLHEALADLDSE